MNILLYPLVLSAALVCGALVVSAQPAAAPAESDDLRAVLETLRSDFNGFKIRTLNQALRLTAPEAEKFWPIYRNYERELARVAERKIELLREFGVRRTEGTLSQTIANTMAQRWLENAQARLDLWKKYQKKISKAVSPARAAEFLQIEHQIGLFIDLNIAAEMPALGTVIPKGQP